MSTTRTLVCQNEQLSASTGERQQDVMMKCLVTPLRVVQTLLVFVSCLSIAVATDYFERLDLTPLPLGSLLASFEFRSNETLEACSNQDFRYFPRSLGQVLQHADTKELHLRFSFGRWDTETWGARPWDGTKEGATGVELWAWIEADNEAEAMRKWLTLNQALSGLFCASMNFIDETRTTKPSLSFQHTGDHKTANLHLLHGVLPGEVVCTENLTPFLKLLPCKGKAGVASLLDGHKVFDASWQSMSVDVRPLCPAGQECVVEIDQTIDMVLNIARAKRPREDPIPRPVQPHELICDETKSYHSHDTCYPIDALETPAWSLKDIFGRPAAGACPLAEEEGPEAKSLCLNIPHSQGVWIGAGGFEVRSPPGEPEKRCYQMVPGESFDFDMPKTSLRTHKQIELENELITTERTMTGHGAAKGGMRTVFTNPSATDPVNLVLFESLPWFLRPFMHTLKAQIVDTEFPFEWEVVKDVYYRPAVDRKRGTQIEIVLSIPPASVVMVTYDFEKAILRYTEYPPDANRGFIVAPAVVRILDKVDANGKAKAIYLRTTSLLLSLPTPDFSMPYNVIILTSTVMALAFGSIFNILIRRFVAFDEVPENKIAKMVKNIKFRMATLKEKITGTKAGKTE
ncbi:Subunit of the glycosylphosphatidylinositol transamidase complex-like protein [Knufia obscura]|uniref:Subunit of the glycosylphosphatidylinositol transamidase complex-like protein n=2 Tax=Knufia TaxID=430999 RepID=A0AAN8E844_9EURO|nr:Subunit of the glycosylphosphatidylinositol transamidase complex-like protein [Knufia obscura]KAK5948569.1 Subunit of the glycosylphosphatidylinositol transamidase complex-like protein [Knufia fluminis]